MEENINVIDKNLIDGMTEEDAKNIEWHDVRGDRVNMFGLAFFSKDKAFQRTPMSMNAIIDKVNPQISILAKHTSGGNVHFTTTATSVYVRVKLKNKHNMSNMPATGQDGVDAYVRYKNDNAFLNVFRFFGVSKFDIQNDCYVAQVTFGHSIEAKDIILYLPLYENVESMHVGVYKGEKISPANHFKEKGKFVFYGTSITQGGCASRPGMSYSNILSRRFGVECINLGFSANGLGEIEIADVIGQITEVKLVVIDYEANSATNGKLVLTLENFVRRVRYCHQNATIIIVSRVRFLGDYLTQSGMAQRKEFKEFQKSVVRKINAEGDKKVFFVDGEKLWDDNFDEYTVDYIHPSDLGFWNMANSLEKEIKLILNKEI